MVSFFISINSDEYYLLLQLVAVII